MISIPQAITTTNGKRSWVRSEGEEIILAYMKEKGITEGWIAFSEIAVWAGLPAGSGRSIAYFLFNPRYRMKRVLLLKKEKHRERWLYLLRVTDA